MNKKQWYILSGGLLVLSCASLYICPKCYLYYPGVDLASCALERTMYKITSLVSFMFHLITLFIGGQE